MQGRTLEDHTFQGVTSSHFDYELERAVLERICTLADEGHDIVANGEVILEKNRGAEMLINVDMEAPSYSWMDEHMPF